MWDRLRRSGVDAPASIRAISATTGLDPATVRRQLARSLVAEGRNPEREIVLRNPSRRAA
jgi:hypothetical protein